MTFDKARIERAIRESKLPACSQWKVTTGLVYEPISNSSGKDALRLDGSGPVITP